MRLGVVVPCFNEERRLPADAFAAWLAGAPAAELLFVDDGSRDGTLAVLHRLAAAAPGRADVLPLGANGGKAEAVRRGMLALLERGYDAVGFWDADLATPLDDIAVFRRVLETRAGAQWVFGSRVRLLGRHIERYALRHYLGRGFATAASIALRLPIYDTQCGAKLFRASPELRAVLAEPFMSRWIFEVEMIGRLAHVRGATFGPQEGIVEVPLERWADVRGSKVRAADFLRAAGELVRIRVRYPPRRLAA